MFKYQGDLLLISPFLQALKNHVGHAQIDCLLFSHTSEMLSGHKAIKEMILYKKPKGFFKRIGYDICMGARIRKKRYDLFFNMTQGDRGALFSLASGAKIRVGFDCEAKGFLGKNFIFTHLVAKTDPTRHIVDINLDPLRMIGINPINPEDRKLHFPIDKKSYEAIDRLLTSQNLQKEQFIIFHAPSRCSFKHWPAKNWAALIQVYQKKRVKIILTGGKGFEQESVVRDILAQVKDTEGVVNFCAKTSLKELGALIDRARLLVTIDSVPLHMSSALKKPVVAIFGPSIEGKWGPYQNKQARVVALSMPCRSCNLEGCANTWRSECLERLPVEMVKKEMDCLLGCQTLF